jgi:hypothetical protein
MARLIEVQSTQECRSPLLLRQGDLLLWRAAGGRVRSGKDVMEVLGPFVPAVLDDEGNVLTPLGPPNTVLFRARQPGQAQIEVVTGDPFHAPRKSAVGVTVQP